MGVVYMCIIVLLMVYWMATLELLTGITGIMLFPAFGALSAQFFNRDWIHRHGRENHVEDPDFVEPPLRPHNTADVVNGIICALICVGCLLLGIAQLIAIL